MDTSNLFKTNEDTWKSALSKFNKTLQSLDEDVAVLQQWLKTQPHLPDLLDSHALRNFLMLSKFSIEVTKQKIDNYYTLRKKFEECYGSGHPKLPFNEEFCKSTYVVIYSQLTPEMCRTIYYKVKPESLPESHDPIKIFKRFLLSMQDLRLRKDVMAGDIVIVDFEKVPLSLVTKITPLFAFRCATLYEKIYSIRLKGTYGINTPSFFSPVVALMKRFMKPKLFERIHFLDDPESLKKLVPLELLPKEFGGRGCSLSVLEDALNKSFEEERELFDRLDEMEIDESLRPQKLENGDDWGAFGNFKQLDFD